MAIAELDRLAEAASPENPAVTSSVLAKDPAFYIFTSGTTGAPKASVMTHYRWLRAMGGSGAIGMRLKSSDTVYCCLPLYHNTALTVAVSGVISAGATLALRRPRPRSASRPARSAVEQNHQGAAIRRLHRSGSQRKEVDSQRFSRR